MTRVERMPMPGLLLIRRTVIGDLRGSFSELWREGEYRATDIGPFVQENVSVSRQHVLRGMHLQNPAGHSKLVTVVRGRVWDVVADLRVGSPTFGKWHGQELSDENGCQLYIPVGCAHGFVTLSPEAVFVYQMGGYYAPQHEIAVAWNDPALAITWPITDPILAEKDRGAPTLDRIPPERLPIYDASACRAPV